MRISLLFHDVLKLNSLSIRYLMWPCTWRLAGDCGPGASRPGKGKLVRRESLRTVTSLPISFQDRLCENLSSHPELSGPGADSLSVFL